MEIYIIILLVVILVQTTYVTYNSVTVLKKIAKHMIFIDSSVLIDGRIISIAKSGFLPSGFVIPRSVIGELQFLADNADHDKRMRARHGLDVAHQLRSLDNVEVGLFQDDVRAKDGVDNRLLELARKYEGSICTIDYNLNKVAKVEGINVLNVNELNKELRSAYLPGETTSITIVQKGQDNSQGVGYLEDGTMVVVDSAIRYIGKAVEIEITRSLQTDAGRMMFAKLHGASKQDSSKKDSVAPKRPSGRAPRSQVQEDVAKKVQSKSSAPKLAPKPIPTPAPAPRQNQSTPAPAPRQSQPANAAQKPNTTSQRPQQQKSQPQAQSQQQSRPARHSQQRNRRVTNEDKLMNLIDKVVK